MKELWLSVDIQVHMTSQYLKKTVYENHDSSKQKCIFHGHLSWVWIQSPWEQIFHKE